MEETREHTYCLFCISGQESKVMAMLKSHGYIPLAPLVMHWKPEAGRLKKSARRLLPGYVFFEADADPDWQSIRADEAVLRILQYDDGERAMRDSDAAFVAWLKKYDGTIEISQAVRVGTKLEFIGGPLKDMEGKIVKVNKGRRQVQIALGDEQSMMRTIWCSIEYIEEYTDTDTLRQKC